MVARLAVPLLMFPLVAGACKDDVDLDDAGDTSEGEEDLCGGVAYTRTDLPGTALCLDGASSFQCTWTSNNPAINGVLIEGNHDVPNDTLTLAIPNDARTGYTTYEFALKFGLDGVDLVLELMGVRAGEYDEVAGWTAAIAGDGGLCGGQGGGCDGPCSSDADCGSGRACIATTEGDKCLPAECDTCFDADKVCNYYASDCEFEACSDA